ncbi:LysM peptidoglycan-binding domain-containing protein [Akkermansiaceae bacterium]|nr:LysM peptidoglycan-binding domain-containing protein [Akkermansiaceae bacterium]MDB4383151.1 LysM peptidoglycan-binding domain-containing protein [Akkermansiaceae bacterium]
MKTPRTLQTRRTRPKTGFRIMHAATRSTKKRKQRASTTAVPEDLGEVPGVGVPLALVVILLLHIAAIAGIWIHDKWSESADLKATKVALKDDVPPQRNPALDFDVVSRGETMESIARKHGVTTDSLISANDGITELQIGWKYNIPQRPSTIAGPAAAVAGRSEAMEEPPRYTPQSRPLIQTRDDESIPGALPGPLVEVGGSEAESGMTDEPVLIRPVEPVRVDPVRVDPTRPEPAPASGARQHIVKSGETLWRIAHNNKITVDQLKRANPNVNVSALKIGAKLIIPASQ